MQGYRALGIAESLQRRDLLPLHRDDAVQHDVQQKGCDSEKHHRDNHGGHLDAVELVLYRPMGQLQVPRDRPPTSVGLEQIV